MKKNLLFPVIATMAAVLVSGCSEVNGVPSRAPSGYPDGPKTMVDAQATGITRTLYENLFVLAERGTMFGRQIPTLYGLDGNRKWWAGESTDLSDTKYLTGSHPAVCGWELSNIELDMSTNIDGERFDDVRKHIIAAFARGAVNTISWHCANPVSGGSSWDGTRAVYSIIPGGENHEKFKGWLDRVAEFMLSLRSAAGEPVPLIFRPWHEHTGSGFWWGKGNASAEEFVALWHFTVTYLRDVKGLHNIIWAYSPDMIHLNSRDAYLEYWPGDEWVDILGLDAYDRNGADYDHKGLQMIRLMKNIAYTKNKPLALTETGLENNNPEESDYSNRKWWTQMLYKIIENEPVSFVLLWRNGDFPSNGGHYFGAFRGCYSERDFLDFARRDRILFEDDLPDMYRPIE